MRLPAGKAPTLARITTPPSTWATTPALHGRPRRCLGGKRRPDGGSGSGTGSDDTAIDIGNNTNDQSLKAYKAATTGAWAGAGGLDGVDLATVTTTPPSTSATTAASYDGSYAIGGNGNYASASTFGDETGTNIGALAGFGNNDIASIAGGTSSATAGGGYDGPLSNYDIASVFDPTGTVGSYADAGGNATAGDYDFAAVFGDALNAITATGGNFLTDILPSL